MYVAVKGGEKAIENSRKLLDSERRGNVSVPEISCTQIEEQLGRAVDRVMAEGSLYDRKLAALAVKQSIGDLTEAVFLLRAYRTTLPRFGYSRPVDSDSMNAGRRVSAVFKEIPGGQILGSSFDYTHRLLDFSLLSDFDYRQMPCEENGCVERLSRVLSILKAEGLMEESHEAETVKTGDLTREPLETLAGRDVRLQNLARADEGFTLSMAYSFQRGFGSTGHPFAAEIRCGKVKVEFVPEELGFPVCIGEITLTECSMINKFSGNESTKPCFISGYGFVFGKNERKAMSMALVDRALRAGELGEDVCFPANDPEFVLFHSDNVEASGFVQHLKLPHYVDFQSDLIWMRKKIQEFNEKENRDEYSESVRIA